VEPIALDAAVTTKAGSDIDNAAGISQLPNTALLPSHMSKHLPLSSVKFDEIKKVHLSDPKFGGLTLSLFLGLDSSSLRELINEVKYFDIKSALYGAWTEERKRDKEEEMADAISVSCSVYHYTSQVQKTFSITRKTTYKFFWVCIF